ncbi:Ion-translocating oxidoreductase complex subunit G [subsurface metagenome]
MVVTLFLVTLASSAALGFVYELTRVPIANAKAAKKNLAIKRVTPEFDNQPGEECYKVPAGGDTIYFYIARKGDDTVGYAAETFSNQAFGGSLKLLVGFLPDGTIKETAVLEHRETPGLGDKMVKSKSDWSRQFEGKNPDEFLLKVKKDGGDVDAITASTITSRAYCDALQRAYESFKEGDKQ